MALVKAKCTNCNAEIMTDNGRDAAICPFCMEPYVVAKAIRAFGYSERELRDLLSAEDWLAYGNMQNLTEAHVERPQGGNEPAGRGAKKEAVKEETAKVIEKETVKERTELTGGSIKRDGTQDGELTKEEAELVELIFQAVMAAESEDVEGLYRHSQGDEGTGFVSEEEIRKALTGSLNLSLLKPSAIGLGTTELLQDYAEKYGRIDVMKTGWNEETLFSVLKARLADGGFQVNELCVKTITMNRCEWYEVKEFFGMKTRREKKLVGKELRALYLSCRRTRR